MAEQGAQDSKQLDDIVVIVAAEVVARIGDPPAHPVLGVADRRLQLVAKVFVPGGDGVVCLAGALVVELLQDAELVADFVVD